jgi:anti-sigma-K factor RskA
MADIIRLHGSLHDRVEQLLPWYVNATLSAEDRAMVDAHLAECAECRDELASERSLATAVAGLPVEMEQSWAAFEKRLDSAPVPARLRPVPLWRRPVAAGWMAAPLAAAAAVVLAISLPGRTAVDHTYTALGSASTHQPGNVIVMFAPDTSERQLRATLGDVAGRLVDGPTPTGAYVLSVAPGTRDAAVKRLRANARVTLAQPIDEPIDSGTQP